MDTEKRHAHLPQAEEQTSEQSCCACSGDSTQATDLPEVAGARVFDVSGLDCAEEVRILERVVGPLIGGTQGLAFDVINGRMSVQASDQQASDEAIMAAIADSGMRAVRADGRQSDNKNPTLRWTILSGVALLLGIVLHIVLLQSPLSWHAVFHAHEVEPVPLAEVVAWLTATAFGMRPVLLKAWFAFKSMRPDMNLLMVVAVIGAIAIGELFEAATVAFLFALSLTLESWSVGRARNAVAALLKLAPSTVRIIDDKGEEREIPAAEVLAGTRFVVRAGDRIALDGEVISGMSSVDQAPITGESVPVAKDVGDEVFAGTINAEGTLIVSATRPASDTVLARISRSIGDAYAKRAASEQWVDRFARIYTPVVMVLSLLVFLLPPLLFGAPWQTWIYNALVLLVIACPCALVISTPVSIVAALASAARSGVLIKGGTFVELPASLDAIALDKTGTLTLGEPRVQHIQTLDLRDASVLLADAAALESRSSHPLANAVLGEAKHRGLPVVAAHEVTVLPGRGVRGRVENRALWLGSPRLALEVMAEQHASDENINTLKQLIQTREEAGETVMLVGDDKAVLGLIGLADALRPEAKSVVAQLHAMGVKEVVMLTGDNANTAQAVATAVGIDTVRAGLLPEQKVKEIEALTAKYKVVAMIGDGVNDAPAMARSSFAVAMGAIGSDAAIETADIALMTDDLSRLPWLINHSRNALRIIRQNIVFAISLKIVFVLLTAFGYATLWGAIIADVGATLLVVGNALRLLNAESEPVKKT